MLSGSYSETPTIELWGRTLRWLERLRALSNRPLYDADFDFATAWEVSDHALAVLGCCDSMRDWLRKSDTSLADAVNKLYASANLRACRDIVNTSKHLRINDRHYAVAPLAEAVIRMIGEERERLGETVMWPEEFQRVTEPLVLAIGHPARLFVLFHGKQAPPLDLFELVEGCVAEIGAFVEARGLVPKHEGQRRAYGYPRGWKKQ
jgi:hypothetical protein